MAAHGDLPPYLESQIAGKIIRALGVAYFWWVSLKPEL